ncbi:uncharacterized protein N7503_006932 [Penicillium pulvis]|uniref:uncharacterized protein n=1 Tax=Penicillium pulvis TaxID=1562058 RepID=UPI0025482050|nr:uncharacterized protein N7503_006932 [Penicillium pulvis]KAJ5797636.1 hypothetical protein N7503_006932 [Penicillium pulvis]
MRGFQTVSVVLSSTGLVLADASTFNFRPDNVTLSELYRWVGSYYNGTTYLEFNPYAGLASSETEYCPILRNKTITRNYTTVLCLTEPASYNAPDDPVNAFLTLWPHNFDFSSIPFDGDIDEVSSLEYGLFSSIPLYGNYSMYGSENFNWSLETTQGPPYNLSSTLTKYAGFNYWDINSTIICGQSTVSSWTFVPVTFNFSLNGTNFPDPVVNLQFDGTTANMTMKGYFVAVANLVTGQDVDSWYGNVFGGTFVMSFEGVIDKYHSDVLRNDTDTPTWLRTVGYQNNSLNVLVFLS